MSDGFPQGLGPTQDRRNDSNKKLCERTLVPVTSTVKPLAPHLQNGPSVGDSFRAPHWDRLFLVGGRVRSTPGPAVYSLLPPPGKSVSFLHFAHCAQCSENGDFVSDIQLREQAGLLQYVLVSRRAGRDSPARSRL